MFAQRKMTLGLLIGLTALWTGVGYAADSGAAAPASTSTNSSFKEKYLKNVSASHSLELVGPSTKTLSGNEDGAGNNLSLNHYPSISYKLPKNFGIAATALLTQTFNKDRDNDMLNFSDPYLTFSNSQIINNGDKGFNLYGYLRYYVPVSNATKQSAAAGSANDNGNGKFRLLLAPSQTLFGGKMEASVSGSFYYRLAKTSAARREELTGSSARNDYYVFYAPNLAWNVNPKAQIYVEYFSGIITHSTKGKMPRNRKNPATGESISLGANLFPSKRVSVSPSIAWGPKFLLDTAAIGVFTTIKLL